MNSQSIGIKLSTIAVLTLALLIPVAFVDDVLDERMDRRDAAHKEITSAWGHSQTVVGPILTIPYKYRYTANEKKLVDGKVTHARVQRTGVANATFLPTDLTVGGTMTPKKLHRGIFESIVYSGQLEISGSLPKPDWAALKIDPEDVLWEDGTVSLAISDLRGTQGDLSIGFGKNTIPMNAGSKLPGYSSGVHAKIGAKPIAGDTPFSLSLNLNGSGALQIAPIGTRTKVSLSSTWESPKFMGSFLPVDRDVSDSGFTARWDIPRFGRNFPQISNGRDKGIPVQQRLAKSYFGVSFLSPVDAYRLVERSVKYAILFIAIVFSAFFLFEILSSLRIHPFQYVLVGLSLCLFFLVLLSLSEFIAFGAAYLAAAALTVVMSTLYSASFLKGGKRALLLAAEMSSVYAYLYVVLQMADFSLLMGTALLSGILGAVMYATRHVDWFSLDNSFSSAMNR